jgi:DNA-binding transcriptional MerR regulator
VAWIEFLKRLRATGMPIRDIQRYTNLLRQGEQTTPERLQLLKEHQSRVEKHLKEVERHLEVIRFKVASYEQLHPQPQMVSCGENLP